MKIAVGNDHVGFEMKNAVVSHLQNKGFEIQDYGAYSPESTDYPEYGKKVAEAVVSGQCDAGILICGTGIGISIAANKVPGIRAAVCSEPCSARLAKEHNDANIIAFGARIIGIEMAKMIVDTFLEAEFEGGRHARRVGMLK